MSTDHVAPDGPPELVLSEERLHVGTRWVGVERVRVRTRIVTETRRVEVRVRREELVVEQVALVDDEPAADVPVGAQEPQVIVLHEEVPTVSLATRAYERVRVEVVPVDGEVGVRAALRHEELDLSGTTVPVADTAPRLRR